MENANPTVHHVATRSSPKDQDPFADILASTSFSDGSGDTDSDTSSNYDDEERADPIDAQEVYDLLANITDPEHPLTLSQLAVVNLPHITVHDPSSSNSRPTPSTVLVEITPTIPHCSMAQLIGLCVRVRLERSLPSRFRVDVKVREGTHQSEGQVNKQLADKERVAAACENEQLMGVLGGMMETCV
ncbi:hypothetical protein SAICODRAFT_89919 [Saitoella complicata NRRL Y-17804]|uniref:MIP18 family-like domain-containing protein n=1 Tax=Saitoella complicata (strain BCRC 22490 / CBS 7301 / JCM 7358 / NBRC 10748 / NRRL Y-17804) TaxID=698492 RepID=A0A0E9N7H9_SAICN|nr:uncharacterized protein SAICODRAFT_89919 [Saitoella complicata NRRL Y-17804]ODQ54303.1 hypothetical protein SAICODRAFT_89919 [Saitoella complicata NRRL Y-17804]GAO45763.1 hypothetical protein G7K_0015-t1 [Saitoella complicata NRRL Y-17804]